jgi:mono/diheme cytochrome c family protein
MEEFMRTFKIALAGFILVAFGFAFTSNGFQKPWDVPAKYKTMKNPVKSDATSINTGKTLFAKHCKACHGAKGAADGPKAATLKSKMRSMASKEYKGQTPGEKYYKSFIGRDEMPNFEKKVLDETERWSIINFMDTF